ncbi:30S ribosomal protein THX [Lysobacteraceae bacterium NML93-0792]|nr:30S ribosomal protein THX [Xanthomonadaceae bacterium NML93-0792]PBS15251.1 30S ribosomal protein THX [Xanthomonadaceae bacterium NML93-0793]PBS18086.1 30S ribosomal protein THX [Xanthomonadaceae bacterium NML93-0831]
MTAALRVCRVIESAALCALAAHIRVYRIQFAAHQEQTMGKGDRKTLKGKRYNASYGNSRSKGVVKATGTATAPVVKKAATKTVAKAPAKKAVAKKAAPKAE